MRDHDRPLNDRGHAAAPRMGRWLLSEGLHPDQVICSTANRAATTAAHVCALFGDLTPDQHAELYLSTVDDMLGVLASATGERVLLVAHNPGCELFVEHLTGAYVAMPTAALAQLTFDVDDWTDVLAGRSGTFVRMQLPRHLPDAT